jgi:phosphoglycerol transferase
VASLVAASLSTAIAWVALGLGTMRWDVPLVYSGDALAVASHVKTVIETGWYESQSHLGAPFGQVYHDYPTADNLHFAVARVLGLVLPDWGAVMNVHFLLGFPLAAIAAVWFFRRVGVSTILGAAMAVLYSIAPYHFLRGEGHLFLAWYWVVPLALGLIWSVLRGQPLWGARQDARRGMGHLTGRTGGTLAIVVLLASASAYYAAFTLILGGISAIAAFWVARNWRRLWGAVATAGAIGAVLLINMAPDFLYAATHGANPGALQRTPVETEVYALKLAQLLLPAANHRFGPFRYLREQYDAHYPLPSEGAALGLVGAVGLVALVVVVFLIVVRTVLAPALVRTELMARLGALSFLALLAFLFSTVGGLSTLISFVSTSLRAWNRMSIVIAALALAAVGLLVDALVARAALHRPRPARAAAIGATLAAAVLLVVGVWDQTPAADPAARAATVASFDSDAAFTHDVEAQLPPGSTVFELPYIAFPESPPVNRTLDSDQLRPFLHSNELGFSGGGIRGRADIDSLADIAALPVAKFVAAASELGYAGVIVDTFAYTDDSELGRLESVIASAPLVSDDGRLVFLRF